MKKLFLAALVAASFSAQAIDECAVSDVGIACSSITTQHHEEPPVLQPDPYVVYLDACMRKKVLEFATGMHERGASDEMIDKHVARLLAGPVRDQWLKECRAAYKESK